MGLKHASNRFLKTTIHGWNGFEWVPEITKGSLMTASKEATETNFSTKLRSLVLNPDFPIPEDITLVRINDLEEVYMVGLSNTDVIVNRYSLVTALHKAYYHCTIAYFVKKIAASGAKTGAVRTSLGSYYCDRQDVATDVSKEATIRYGEELVILPRGTPVETSYEITIGTNYYEVESVYDYAGFTYCRCMLKRTPRIDIPLTGSAETESRMAGTL